MSFDPAWIPQHRQLAFAHTFNWEAVPTCEVYTVISIVTVTMRRLLASQRAEDDIYRLLRDLKGSNSDAIQAEATGLQREFADIREYVRTRRLRLVILSCALLHRASITCNAVVIANGDIPWTLQQSRPSIATHVSIKYVCSLCLTCTCR
jgi:hypothetical protein